MYPIVLVPDCLTLYQTMDEPHTGAGMGTIRSSGGYRKALVRTRKCWSPYFVSAWLANWPQPPSASAKAIPVTSSRARDRTIIEVDIVR